MPNVYVRTLMRAAKIAGGEQALAFKLKVTPSHLSLWLGGLGPCPGDVFLKAVDLVLERDIASQAAARPASGSTVP